MDLDARWEFERVSPMGGATGNAYANTLQGAGKSPEEELAREAIQNSCDAARARNGRVRVDFRVVNLHGRRAETFIEALYLRPAFAPRLSALNLPESNCISRPPGAKLQLTYVEDYGTIGLTGNPHHPNSHFHKLLLSVGDTSKRRAAPGMGGSFGYGKAAFSMNSRIRTVVAYTILGRTRDEPGVYARLMACSYFDAHEFAHEHWTGRAWFGRAKTRPGGTVVSPLENEEADRLAQALGFARATDREPGTSILIVDTDLDHSQLVRGIEEWWWPRLLEQMLEASVETEDQKLFPRPKDRPELEPFLECYSLAVGRTSPAGSHQKSDRFRRLNGLSLGCYGVTLLTPESGLLPEDRLGTVALIRAPRMVVEYARLGRPSPPAVGTFVADEDVDEILRLSEPPTHDRWDPDSRRLETAEPDEQTARAVVRHILKRLKDQIRRLQAEASPPRHADPSGIRFLERELGSLFGRTAGSGSSPGGRPAAPVEIRFIEGPTTEPAGQDRVRTSARVSLRLREGEDGKSQSARIRLRVVILENENGIEAETLPLSVEGSQGPLEKSDSDGAFETVVSLTPENSLEFTVRTAPYDAGWSTKLDVEVLPEGEGE
ncbi:MAG: hypothetical protein KatS3mg076_2059 [Candidatus Binatia bacterium]|nr:MAG: hypothetical protein KatS3mg076_2059 [Candidatus Binatia bacterium]